VRSTGTQSAEEAELEKDDDKATLTRTAKDVLDSGIGSDWELDYLFFGIARALGAEANMILTTDRTRHFFDPALLSMRQFDVALLAVRSPGTSDDEATFVDLGSGLPYGEVPWWVTGSPAFLAAPKEHRTPILRALEIRKTVSDTQVKIAFNLEDGTQSVA